ncbi:MAG: haloacid dehalogenase [Actinobacteria bacterium HGW-Actinobacteria-4]|nr:MAG: haloacid dehalogenase [Actinobacteria bacterium HGW-Actinobacteria-4]
MKLIASDIDGTLLPHGGEISHRTAATLQAVVTAGIPLVLVTARPPRWMSVIVDALGHQGEAIVANGAAVMNFETGEVYEQTTITAEDVLAVADILRRELPGVTIAVESALGMSIEEGGWPHAALLNPFESGAFESLEAVTGGHAFKILARVEGHGGADAMIERVLPLLRGLVEPSHSAVDDSLLEFSPVGVSKASALERFAARTGLTAADVIAFGDAPNDIPMLAWAGRSYAMGDGHPAAKAVATHLAAPAADDGVARVLEELFDLAEPSLSLR